MESSVWCIRRQLDVCQPTVGHLLSFVGRLLAGCRPAIYRQSAVCQQLFTDSQPTDLQGSYSSFSVFLLLYCTLAFCVL